LRTLLGVLKEEGDGAALAPQPGIDQLDALLQRVRDAGLPVEVRIDGTPAPLPPGLDLAAYRIVQEGLTNALKYSGLARTQVLLTYAGDELKVEILDVGVAEPNGSAASGRRGLVGMGERVALYGGRLEAGPRLGGGYAVRAWLPLSAGEQ
jgi:signal transduction histidine kinase